MYFDELNEEDFSSSLETSCHFKPKSETGAFISSYLNIDKFEILLWLAWNHSREQVQISRNSIALTPEQRSCDLMRVLPKLIGDGYSLALNYAEKFDPILAELSYVLSNKLGGLVNCAIFFTPPGSSAFRAHYDDVDVFAIQITGSKSWSISREETNLPLGKKTLEIDSLTDDFDQLLLSVGDMLYVPRGKIHSVNTNENEYSLHISFAFNPIKTSDILIEGIKKEMANDILLRSLFNKKEQDQRVCQSKISENLTSNHLSQQNFRTIRAKHISSLNQLPGSLVCSLKKPVSGSYIMFKRRNNMPSELFLSEGCTSVRFSIPGLAMGKIDVTQSYIEFPASALTILEFIRDSQESFILEELPGPHSTESKSNIVERLILEGYLEKIE